MLNFTHIHKQYKSANFWLATVPSLSQFSHSLALLLGATLSQHYIWPNLALLSFLERDITEGWRVPELPTLFEAGLKPKGGRILA